MVGGRFVIVAHWGEQWERQGWRERYGRAEEVVAFSFKIGTQRKKQESAVRNGRNNFQTLFFMKMSPNS